MTCLNLFIKSSVFSPRRGSNKSEEPIFRASSIEISSQAMDLSVLCSCKIPNLEAKLKKLVKIT